MTRFANLFLTIATASAIATSAHAATSIPFTVNMSEAVDVVTTGGTPRISVDVGGVTRYATYSAGTGTSALTFTYDMVAGDVDLDGVTLSSPISLNGGTIKDLNGNNATLTFTVPDTSNVKVNYPSLSMDFVYDADGRYTLNGTTYNDLSSFLTAAGGTFSRASVATYYDSSGILQTAASGATRFDYNPSTFAAKGLLIEESRTNSTIYNNRAGQAASVAASTITGPNGVVSGYKITCDGTNTVHAVAFGTQSTVSGTTYTESIFVKAGTQTKVQMSISSTMVTAGNGYANFDLSAGTTTLGAGATASGMVQLPNSWWRIWVTYTANGAGGSNINQVSAISSMSDVRIPGNTSTGDFYVFGPQKEIGSFVTSYIPTTTASVTRPADVVTIPTGSWYSSTQSTLYGYGSTFGVNTASTFADLNDASFNNRFQIRVSGGPVYGAIITSGGVVQTSIGSGTYTLNQTKKMAMAGQLNDVAYYADGASRGTDNSVTMPISVSRIRIGNVGTGSEFMNGSLQTIKYYPTRVANTQLQLMTQ